MPDDVRRPRLLIDDESGESRAYLCELGQNVSVVVDGVPHRSIEIEEFPANGSTLTLTFTRLDATDAEVARWPEV